MLSSFIISEDKTLDCRNISIEYSVHEYHSRTLKETVISQLRKKQKVEKFQALKGVDVAVGRGECVALIGHNGSGKSTMLKVMAGILPPTHGSVVRNGSCIPLIELGAGFDPELTGRENIFLCLGLLGLSRKDITSLVPVIRDFSELSAHLDVAVKTYSSGMYMRLGFACSVCVQADILLVDEILAVGDENFQKKCIGKMREIRKNGSTMVLVSHDLSQIQQMADRVIVFDQGSKVFEGYPSDAIAFYHDLMDQKRIALIPQEIRDEEARLKSLKLNDETRDFGTVVKLRTGLILTDLTTTDIIAGKDSQLTIEFDVLEELEENPCIGFAIHTLNGMRLLGGNSNKVPSLVASSFRLPGRYKMTFLVPNFALAAGSYRLIIAAHNSDLTKTFDLNGEAQNIEVINKNDAQNFDGDLLDFDAFVGSVQLNEIGRIPI